MFILIWRPLLLKVSFKFYLISEKEVFLLFKPLLYDLTAKFEPSFLMFNPRKPRNVCLRAIRKIKSPQNGKISRILQYGFC